uniref:PHYHIP_C domain-containing protein n=1 Tax=Syphacia muris TaxID=451379 RepID=A0A0N5A8C6_9BILA
MWNDNDYYYLDREPRYRPVWSHRPHRPPFPSIYARPREVTPFMKPEMGTLMGLGMAPLFPRIPELATPHAVAQRLFPPSRPSYMPLYQDFSAPARPLVISMNIKTSALKCLIEWKHPNVPKTMKYKYKLEIWEGVQCEVHELPSHCSSFSLKTTPGSWYKSELTCVDKAEVIIAVGRARFKAGHFFCTLLKKQKALEQITVVSVFSYEEMQMLYKKALDFVGTAMHSFHVLYRCKPKMYYDDIHFHYGGIMEKYLKDNNGQAASSINGAISGLFFSARLSPDGSLPTHSPFGNVRMRIQAFHLLDPARINMYFSDFYCNYITHYVTVVICEKNSETDIFCMQRLIKLPPDSNPFLRTIIRPPLFEPEFWVNKNVWVEIYYTENVPLSLGTFDTIIATGAGTSRVGGLPHNKQCQLCNLYPQKAFLSSTKSQLGSKLNSTFQLLLNMSKEDLEIDSFDCADVIETICMLIDSVVDQSDQEKCMEIEESEPTITQKQLDPPSDVIAKLSEKPMCEEMKEAVLFLTQVTIDLDKYFELVAKTFDEAKQDMLSGAEVIF